MCGKIKNIRHLGIVVKDLDISLRFYMEILNLVKMNTELLLPEETYRYLGVHEHLICIKLKPANTRDIPCIELYHFPYKQNIETNKYTHISLTVTNIEKIFNTMKNLNLLISQEIIVKPKVKVFFGTDPGHNLIEFVETL